MRGNEARKGNERFSRKEEQEAKTRRGWIKKKEVKKREEEMIRDSKGAEIEENRRRG